LAKAVIGFTGADIKNFVNISVLNCVKENRTQAIHEDFEWALDRVRMGIGRKKMSVSEKEKFMTAYHEGGHTLVNL
jgi:ATP-dependent metalloprotease